MNSEAKLFVEGLNKLASIYENHPELPVPYLGDIYSFVESREKLVEVVKTIAKYKPRKDASDSYYQVNVKLSPSINLQFCIERQKVCERIKTGTKLVEVPAKPATEARVDEIPVYEWKCVDSLLAPGIGEEA